MFEWHDGQRIAHIEAVEIFDLTDLTDPGLKTAFDYWNEVRRSSVAPPIRDFRLERLPMDILPSTAVVDFLGPPFDFRYRFFGTQMVEIAGQELTGKRYLADEIKGFGFVNAEVLPVMVERRTPVYSGTRWVSVKGLMFKTITVRLPLSEDGDAITGAVVIDRFAPDRD
ncbi:MAG: hypothetical protein RIB80_05140 [Rhodospirillales bacterium]